VTGSAHCTLAPFWAARLRKRRLRARQLSARGGELDLAFEASRAPAHTRRVRRYDARASGDLVTGSACTPISCDAAQAPAAAFLARFFHTQGSALPRHVLRSMCRRGRGY